jgi:hypothetical protein
VNRPEWSVVSPRGTYSHVSSPCTAPANRPSTLQPGYRGS